MIKTTSHHTIKLSEIDPELAEKVRELRNSTSRLLEDFRSEGCPDPDCHVCRRSKAAEAAAREAIDSFIDPETIVGWWESRAEEMQKTLTRRYEFSLQEVRDAMLLLMKEKDLPLPPAVNPGNSTLTEDGFTISWVEENEL